MTERVETLLGSQAPDRSKYNSIRQWFLAGQALGEFIGIRFGYCAGRSAEPRWVYYPHSDYDGIGAFADILRQRGAHLKRLPEMKYYPAYSAIGSALKHWPRYLRPRKPISWVTMQRASAGRQPPMAARAVAWHVFDQSTTDRMRLHSRKSGVTVNTFLLKALTDAIRPSLQDQRALVPWMVPVNMRGGVNQARDTDNHSSYVAIAVPPDETAFQIHRRLLLALSRGEHWGNWHAFKLGRCLTHGLRVWLVRQEMCFSQWNIGSFSNLGEWDPEKTIVDRAAVGDWLFCPPTLRSQMLAAGCLTFQGRLSLTIQAHPELTTDETVTRRWMQRWVAQASPDAE